MDHVAGAPAGPIRRKREWRHAWRALRNLMDDRERTDQLFVVVHALSGSAFERAYARLAASADGRRLLAERPSLLAALSDRDAVAALPEGSLGRSYFEFMQAGGLDAAGLVEAERSADRKFAADEPLDPALAFFDDRLRDAHDLWHVLTGYGRDEIGEAANLAFTLGQVWNLGTALIVVTLALTGPKTPTCDWQRYLFRAWRRGRTASPLTAAPFERMLPLPLDVVRRQLGIRPSREVHPGGILVGNL